MSCSSSSSRRSRPCGANGPPSASSCRRSCSDDPDDERSARSSPCSPQRRGDAIVVTGPSALSGALYATDPDAPVLYNMELAYATACAFGIAISVGERPVIAIEGDGSAIAGLGGLATIARYRPANLTIVLIDNGVWGTGDNTIATPTALGADLAAAAVGARLAGRLGASRHRHGRPGGGPGCRGSPDRGPDPRRRLRRPDLLRRRQPAARARRSRSSSRQSSCNATSGSAPRRSSSRTDPPHRGRVAHH